MKYELMVLLSPKQTDKEIEKNLKEIKGILDENGFKLVDEDVWGMRDLAYTVAGNDRGFYVVYNFMGETGGIAAVKRDLTIQPGLLRHLLIKVADDHALMRYEGGLTMAKSAKAAKLSTPAEELNNKVRSSSTGAKKPVVEAEAPAPQKQELDEKLKAIIEDKDIL